MLTINNTVALNGDRLKIQMDGDGDDLAIQIIQSVDMTKRDSLNKGMAAALTLYVKLAYDKGLSKEQIVELAGIVIEKLWPAMENEKSAAATAEK